MKSVARWSVIFLFGAVVAGSSPARADDPSRKEVAKAGKAASAFVQLKDRTGSAFCVHPSGLFLTNHHVIDGDGEVTLVLNANQKDQRVVKAKVLRSDREADLALLKVEGVKDLPSLQIGSDENLSEGDELIACGFPFGKGLALEKDEYPAVTITFGKVTSLRQKARELELIQFDVELHPGNSGGPILGSDGKVLGVAVAIIKGTNFRFAIPARKVRRFLEQPTVTFQPPTPPSGDWQKPVHFEVRAVSVLPSEKPFEIELILCSPDGKERKHSMKRTEDVYRVEAPLQVTPAAVTMVRTTIVVSRDGKELARLSNWIVNEGKLTKVYLADLPEVEFKKGPWDLGKGSTGDPAQVAISVAGQKSPKGLGMHPNCSVSYRLKKGGLLFRSKVGIDDSGRVARAGEILFEVLGDGKLLWASKPLFIRGEMDECSIDVAGVNTLELRVSVKGINIGAHAVWLEPHVLASENILRPETVLALDNKDQTIKRLPAAVDDVALGGGGRYLILSLPKVRKLAVLDVTKPSAEQFIEMDEEGAVRIATGADKLLVLYVDKKILNRYSLTTMKKEASIDLPFEGKVMAMAIGSASHGPLYLVGEKPPLTGVTLLMDVQRMRRIEPEMKGRYATHTGDGVSLLASTDGRVFGFGGNFFSRGFHTAVVEGNTITVSTNGDKPQYACPGPDGRFIFTNSGLYTSQLQNPEKGARHSGSVCLPAAQGDFYLKANTDSFSLYLAGDDDSLLKITGAGSPGSLLKDQTLPYFKRIFLLPAANLIVTIPAGNDEVHFHRFAFSKALEKASDDYLFVTAFAPPTCQKGKAFVYELGTQSKKGGVKCQIVSGPKGMTTSENGKIKWDVPKAFAEGVSEVRVQLRDASGRERIHSFRVRVE